METQLGCELCVRHPADASCRRADAHSRDETRRPYVVRVRLAEAERAHLADHRELHRQARRDAAAPSAAAATSWPLFGSIRPWHTTRTGPRSPRASRVAGGTARGPHRCGRRRISAARECDAALRPVGHRPAHRDHLHGARPSMANGRASGTLQPVVQPQHGVLREAGAAPAGPPCAGSFATTIGVETTSSSCRSCRRDGPVGTGRSQATSIRRARAPSGAAPCARAGCGRCARSRGGGVRRAPRRYSVPPSSGVKHRDVGGLPRPSSRARCRVIVAIAPVHSWL